MTAVGTRLTTAILLWICWLPASLVGAFRSTPISWGRVWEASRLHTPATSTTLWHVDDKEEGGVVRGNQFDQPSDSTDLYKALRARNEELKKRIGLRYLVCAKDKGTVNVYRDPKSPTYSTQHVIGTLEHGKIIKSTGKPLGNWIHHDMGWSLARYEGFDNLILIDE